MEHHDVLNLLRVLRDEKQALADKLHDARDYSAEFPAGDAEALQYALDHLSLEGPLPFSARYYKAKYEALANPEASAVLRALVVANPGTAIFTPDQFDAMRKVLKAAFAPHCLYPNCNCPFDAPANPEWCARGLPRE